jgi:hypothetical protein
MNAFVRCKLALTEDNPTIKPYKESYWAELPDGRDADPALSLALLEALHARWSVLLDSLGESDYSRGFIHPENGPRDLDWLLSLYSWHGRHHVAQINGLRQRMGW